MKEILLNTVYKTKNYKKYSALIDSEDYLRASKYNWFVVKRPNTMYAVTWINGKQIYLHNFIMGFKGIDHEDLNGLNNQKYNLRGATCQQNAMNKPSRKNSTSRFKGVSWFKRDKKWESYIRYNSGLIHLGYFGSEIEAAKRYNAEAKKLFGKFARLNEVWV